MTTAKINLSSSDYILETSREYSIYVCESRSIPKVSDGLKDVQRKAVWLVRNQSEKIKTVSLSGSLISSGLYVHGDASASDAISKLAAPFLNNVPLLEGIGTFGTRTAPVDGIGAPRYTYVRRGTATQRLLLTDLDLVPLKENYDGSAMEPVHFLPLIPMVLLNGVSGIAVAWSTEILPRRLEDLIDACVGHLDGKPIARLVPNYRRYDVDISHIEGNSWQMNGRVEIMDASTLRVTELPPDLSLSKFKEKLNALEEDDKIQGYVDRSTKTIDITVKMSRGSVKTWTVNQALDYLKLRAKKTERIVVVDYNNNSIRQYTSAEEVVANFVDWRLGWFSTRYQHMLDESNYELAFWKAIRACFDDNLPARLAKKKNRADIQADVVRTIQGIHLDDSQMNRILSMPSYRWAQDAYQEVLDKIQQLESNILSHTATLADPVRLRAIYREELVALRKANL